MRILTFILTLSLLVMWAGRTNNSPSGSPILAMNNPAVSFAASSQCTSLPPPTGNTVSLAPSILSVGLSFCAQGQVPFEDIGAEGYETQQRQRELTSLQRKAAKLGFDLMPKEAALVPTPA